MNSSDAIFVSKETRTIHNICASTIAFFGFTTNFIVVTAMIRSKLYRKVANVFVLNLTINNMTACGVCLTYISVMSFVVQNTHGSGINHTLCQMVGYITYSIVTAELIGLALISLNRFFLVVYFDMYLRIYNKNINIVIMITISWTFFSVLFILPLTKLWGSFVYDPQRFFCQPFYANDSFAKFLFGFCLLITMPIICFCYVAILYKTWSSRRKINVIRSTTTETTGNKIRSKSDTQLVMTVILIVTTFMLMYVPFLIMSVIDSKMVKYKPEMHVSFLYIAWFHCVINPCVYSIINPQIKKSCLLLLRCAKYNNTNSGLQFTVNTVA